MKDFFSQQDQARRNTGLLVLLFLLAVAALILITNLAVMLSLWGFEGFVNGDLNTLANQGVGALLAELNWQRFGLISLLVCGTVCCAVVYKRLQLADGGKAVAESLGGVRIATNTDDAEQRKALNVVEEMALASGMPVPPVYLLPHELGINAFAAGNNPSDAVIGLTQGTLERLDRPQLQGVVAHEFSHILNGDMRLNMQLIALLHGIVFIGSLGEVLLRFAPRRRSGSSDKGVPQLAALGLVLMLVGWLGNFFGRLIKASVSRQREFLADASAVQFTRNPQGIADALKVIGGHSQGTEVDAPRSGEVSHLFFGRALESLSGLYATHPPLMERVFRLDPDWDGSYIYPKPSQLKKQQARQQERQQQREAEREAELQTKQQAEQQRRKQALGLGVVLAGGSAELLDSSPLEQARATIDGMPAQLVEQAHEPLGAMALVFGLLGSQQLDCLDKQQQLIGQLKQPGLVELCQRLQPQFEQLPRAHYLALLELSLPTLKSLSEPQYRAFHKTLLLVIRLDQQTSLFEWCLYQLVQHYLAAEFGKPSARKPRKARFSQPQELAEPYQLVVSLLAHQGHDNTEDAEKAFNRAVGSAGLYNLRLLPESECQLDAFIKAANLLAQAKPLLKPRLLKGLENCVKQDNQITPLEREIISALFVLMESPLPQLPDPAEQLLAKRRKGSV